MVHGGRRNGYAKCYLLQPLSTFLAAKTQPGPQKVINYNWVHLVYPKDLGYKLRKQSSHHFCEDELQRVRKYILETIINL
jgi:hypothetical protein